MTGKKNWRLSKTLARRIEVRPIEKTDLRYAWAAYKKGGLSEMGFANDLGAPEFKTAFENALVSNHDDAWIVQAVTPQGFMPIGMVVGGWANRKRTYLVIEGIAWFPWATKRNIIEGTVAFFNKIRKEIPWVGYAMNDDKRAYEVCCMHGIMRRVGTTHVVFPGHSAAVYEGRA